MRSTKSEIAEVLSGKTTGEKKGFPFIGVEYDSRLIRGGELFVALKGEHSHGHAYLDQVFERGAALALIEDQTLLDTHPERERMIWVPETLQGFWKLASWWRSKLNKPTIAVTGSVGKTTTKEILASILLQSGPGNYALKSFNNHVGVPYTLCRTSHEHEWAVIEVGMNRPGEIGKLSRVVMPDVAVVTEVAPAHIGAFGSIEGIAQEKLSIVVGLKEGATLVVNGDNPHIATEIERLKLDARFSIIRVGTAPQVTARAYNIVPLGMESVQFSIDGEGVSCDVLLKIPGVHSAKNALIAAIAAKKLIPGISNEQIKKGIESFTAPLMRLNLKETKEGKPLLDDSYNANPASMRAMLEIAGERSRAGLKVGLILGDMLELGEDAEKYHREIGESAAAINPAFIIAVGEMARFVCEKGAQLGIDTIESANAEEAAKMAVNKPFDMVFVKGSRGVGLDRTVALLVQS